MTRSLTAECLAPLPLHQPHRIAAHIASRSGRALRVSGTGTDRDGVTRFSARAVFIAVSVDHFAAHGDLGAFDELLNQFSRNSGPRPDRCSPR